jgi:hypothetical protein
VNDAEQLLDRLWLRYAAEVQPARIFVELSGGSFKNDHVAFRSLRRIGGGIDLFAKPFERLGWQRAERYEFPDVHLEAIYLRHPDGLPRVFISELIAERLSARARTILAHLPQDPPLPADPNAYAGWFTAADTPLIEEDLVALNAESQYAAWLLAFGRKVNHFTGAVDDVEAWQSRLSNAGVRMKPEIEGDRQASLRQTATLPATLPVHLHGGRTLEWPYAYFELAQRKTGFDGFLAPQARRLFEMTRR